MKSITDFSGISFSAEKEGPQRKLIFAPAVCLTALCTVLKGLSSCAEQPPCGTEVINIVQKGTG
jgi:hypothetical protein